MAPRGCPVGTLCSELHKEGRALADRATVLFDELLTWSEAQFRELGCGSESSNFALHLMSSLQGASLLAHVFHDPAYVVRETDHLIAWIRGLGAARSK